MDGEFDSVGHSLTEVLWNLLFIAGSGPSLFCVSYICQENGKKRPCVRWGNQLTSTKWQTAGLAVKSWGVAPGEAETGQRKRAREKRGRRYIWAMTLPSVSGVGQWWALHFLCFMDFSPLYVYIYNKPHSLSHGTSSPDLFYQSNPLKLKTKHLALCCGLLFRDMPNTEHHRPFHLLES